MTTVVAWLALLVSGSSLGWQIVVWKKSAARVVVDLEKLSVHLGKEEDHDVVVVVATNVGRAATTINEVGVIYLDPTAPTLQSKHVFGEVKTITSAGSGLPKRLEPGEEFQTSFRTDYIWGVSVFAPSGEAGDKAEVQGYMRVGSETLFAPRSITLDRPSTSS